MKKLTRITLAWLKQVGACEQEQELFRVTFGKSAAINKENMLRAVKAGLNLYWLLSELTDRRLVELSLEARHDIFVNGYRAYQTTFKARRKALAKGRRLNPSQRWAIVDKANKAAGIAEMKVSGRALLKLVAPVSKA